MQRSVNKRFLSSQDKIQQSIIELLDSYDSDKITISLICKKANINRSTFYSYYKSFEDLLQSLEAKMTKKLVAIYHQNTAFSREFFHSNDFLIPFLVFVHQNQSFVRFYLEHQQKFPLDSSFPFIWNEVALPYSKELGITSEDDLLYYYIYFQSGIFMIIKQWLQNSCKESPEHMAQIIRNCLLKDLKDTPQ